MNLLRGLTRRCWTSYTTAASRVTFVSVSDLLLTWSVFGSCFRNNHIGQTMELRFQIRHNNLSFHSGFRTLSENQPRNVSSAHPHKSLSTAKIL